MNKSTPSSQTPERSAPAVPEQPRPGTEEAAESGLPGYGQPPPGVRTDRLEGGPEFDWPKKQAPSK